MAGKTSKTNAARTELLNRHRTRSDKRKQQCNDAAEAAHAANLDRTRAGQPTPWAAAQAARADRRAAQQRGQS